jgi:hypothetical protein
MVKRLMLMINQTDPTALPAIFTDDPTLEILVVDDGVPEDRIYRLGKSVVRVKPEEFDTFITSPIHAAGDKPELEQAARARLNLDAHGKPKLQVIE